MKSAGLIRKNIAWFVRYYKLVGGAIVVAVAVISGSLFVGDSVRMTLVRRVAERLGDTQTIVFSRNAFLSGDLADDSLFQGTARGILLVNGFIPDNGRLIPVFVWGVDDRGIPAGSAAVNDALRRELKQGVGADTDIVLRLPASGLVPSGSLFVTENYTTSMRLSLARTIPVEEGGNLSMKNEQTIPLNIFVDRNELAGVLEAEGKINLILSDKTVTADDLEKAWDYSMSGLSFHTKEGFTEIVSDRVFLQQEVVEAVCAGNRSPNRLFSYLANSIGTDEVSIPYSFVTAVDRYGDEPLGRGDIILSDYSAKRLHARTGDSVTVSYYISKDLKVLTTDSLTLRVKQIVPLGELQEDKTLSAEFPGLSDVERCTDWDSDLPINMDLITGEDENYWELYRSTPKAIIAYEAVAGKWGNAYGSATAIRVADTQPDLSGLRAGMFGVQVIHPREGGMYAAMNGVDFSGLFLALGFFIIVAAMLLMQIPLSEMLYRRRDEFALLNALGYSRKKIRKMLWREATPVVSGATVAGVVAGLLYTLLIIWLLGNVWKGATHTEGFSFHPDLTAVAIALQIGIGLSLVVLYRRIAVELKEKRASSSPTRKGGSERVVFSTVLAISIILINLFFLQSVALFVVAGIVLIGAAAVWGDYLIRKKGTASIENFDGGKLVWSSLLANRKQAIRSFIVLAIGVFTVFSVGLNRKGFADSSQLRTGTGNYTLWCESMVPVYHDMNTQAGRGKLALTALPAQTRVLQCLRYGADEASCLNLNKVTTPTVLGIDLKTLAENGFRIDPDACSRTGSAYPALVDETVLTWSLGMSLGDTLYYESDRGQRVAVRLAGTLPNTIFQGNILIDRTFFTEIWGETTGSEVFLLKTDEAKKEEVATLLSQALNEYGVRVTTTAERLKQFNTVTDTYLTIFMTLGALGLLLGLVSFVIVIRKNLVMRTPEIEMYRMLGFPDSKIKALLYRENCMVPLCAIATGVVSSLVGAGISFMNAGVQVWMMALLVTVALVACVIGFVKRVIGNIL